MWFAQSVEEERPVRARRPVCWVGRGLGQEKEQGQALPWTLEQRGQGRGCLPTQLPVAHHGAWWALPPATLPLGLVCSWEPLQGSPPLALALGGQDMLTQPDTTGDHFAFDRLLPGQAWARRFTALSLFSRLAKLKLRMPPS